MFTNFCRWYFLNTNIINVSQNTLKLIEFFNFHNTKREK